MAASVEHLKRMFPFVLVQVSSTICKSCIFDASAICSDRGSGISSSRASSVALVKLKATCEKVCVCVTKRIIKRSHGFKVMLWKRDGFTVAVLQLDL